MIHQFSDLKNIPFEFDEITERMLFMKFMTPEHEIILYNNYLARINKRTNKIDFFHRFIIQQIKKNMNTTLEVHHKDGNKYNNKIENLELLSPEHHEWIHERNKERGRLRAFETYCEKKYGYIDECYEEEFEEWLEGKI